MGRKFLYNILMNKKIIAALVGAGLITVVGVFFFLKNRTEPDAQDPSQFGSEAAAENAEFDSAFSNPPQELKFNQQLLIELDAISVDGGAFLKVPCTPDGTTFALLKWGNTTAEMICRDDYLGGIELRFKGKSGEDLQHTLAQSDGDAGESWDMRSLVVRTENGGLKIETLSFKTTEEQEGTTNGPITCSSRKFAVSWNDSEKNFVSADFSGAMKEELFNPPSQLLQICQDGHGKWQDGLKQQN